MTTLASYWLDLNDAKRQIDEALVEMESKSRVELASLIFDAVEVGKTDPVRGQSIQDRLAELAQEGFREI